MSCSPYCNVCLAQGEASAAAGPVEYDDGWFTLDNRRLLALQQAALERWPRRCCCVGTEGLGLISAFRTSGGDGNPLRDARSNLGLEGRTPITRGGCDLQRSAALRAKPRRRFGPQCRVTSIQTLLTSCRLPKGWRGGMNDTLSRLESHSMLPGRSCFATRAEWHWPMSSGRAGRGVGRSGACRV